MNNEFIGREEELDQLKSLLHKRSASMIVVKGRRRIGKSRLLDEFSRSFEKVYKFSGLPPVEGQPLDPQSQRDEFALRLAMQTHAKNFNKEDWSELFWVLAHQTQQGRTLIILDEISWMDADDPHFLGKLKNAWDLSFKQNNQLMLAICGSAAAWIEKNILSSTGFLGRESLSLTVKELPLNDCVKFWGKEQHKISAYEKIKLLSVTGGIPRYLEHIDLSLSADDNIRNLCFTESGILFDEFEKIFSDLFYPKNKYYKEIMQYLVNGIADQKQITKKIGLPRNGDTSEYLSDLMKTDFISRDFTWKIADGKFSNLSHYRLKDNYSRFYLKYIKPNKSKIKLGNMRDISLTHLDGWSTIQALQFENLVLSNRNLIKKALKINLQDIICDNPYFQRPTTKQKGCQIDYLIQTKNHVYICEIKYSKRELQLNLVNDMQNKVARLKLPKHVSYRTVLIHINGVSEALEDSQYFSNIVDFSEFLGLHPLYHE